MARYFLISRRYQESVDVVFSFCLQIPADVFTTHVVLSCVDSNVAFATTRQTSHFVAGGETQLHFSR